MPVKSDNYTTDREVAQAFNNLIVVMENWKRIKPGRWSDGRRYAAFCKQLSAYLKELATELQIVKGRGGSAVPVQVIPTAELAHAAVLSGALLLLADDEITPDGKGPLATGLLKAVSETPVPTLAELEAEGKV